jgi:phospholipid/cholesterol/gamma-HCH transport system substrate-binding protein
MSRSPLRDFVVGLFVVAGFAAIGYLSLSVGGVSIGGGGGLELSAEFDEIGGLKTRAPVVISGVKVGQVTDISLASDYRARVGLDLDRQLELPTDTSASIVTAGILGDRYISLQLGGEEKMLKSGDQIAFTESAVLLERLIGKLVYNAGSGGGSGSNGGDSGGGAGAGAKEKTE